MSYKIAHGGHRPARGGGPDTTRADVVGQAGVATVFRFFFFQAEDGKRDYKVTGVQTCALPIDISDAGAVVFFAAHCRSAVWREEIGRASCRGRGENLGVAGYIKKKKQTRQ